MIFMLVATITSLIITVYKKVILIASAGAVWGDWFQLIFAAAMVVLAVILVIQGIQTFATESKAKKA
jgi:carbon starvation protein